MTVASIKTINDHGEIYKAIMLWCPGCEKTSADGVVYGGLHLLPISGSRETRPTWIWDHNLERPTLYPSILTRGSGDSVCHSFLRDGTWIFLQDSTHKYAGQEVPMVDLPDWAIAE